MKILLSNPRVLGSGKPASFKHYPKGMHEVADDVVEHWFTQAQMKTGDITVLAPEKPAAPSPKSPQPKAEK